MMNSRPLWFAGLLALGLAGCVRETPPAPPPSMPGATNAPTAVAAFKPKEIKSDSDRLKIGVVPKGMTHIFWQTVKAGADAAGQELNAEIIWQGPKAETDVQDQKDILTRLASENVDGIAAAATDKTALSPTVDELQGQGIPIVIIDSGIEPDHSQSFIATDNVAAARQAAEELGKLLGGKGEVAVLSFKKGAGTSDEREQGFLEGIKAFPDIKVVDTQYTDSDAAVAQNRMETMLSAHPNLVGVFASNEPNVNGAAQALKTHQKVGTVKLVGFDASPSELKYLTDGVVQALMVQDPFKMGYEGVKAIAQIVRGKGSPEKRIDTGAKVVTKANMNEPDVHKLLFPMEKK